MTPVIIAVKVLIAGVLLLMAYFAYQYIITDDLTPARSIPAIADAEDSIPDVPLNGDEPEPEPEVTTTPPVSMTRATTTPPNFQ